MPPSRRAGRRSTGASRQRRRATKRATGFRRLSIAFALLTGGVLWLTLAPIASGPDIGEHGDKWVHVIMFMVWSLMFGYWLLSRGSKRVLRTIWLAVPLAGTFFGVVIELLQTTMPFGRNGDMFDAMANLAGSLLAAAVLQIHRSSGSTGVRRQ